MNRREMLAHHEFRQPGWSTCAKKHRRRKRLADCLKTLGDDIVRYHEIAGAIVRNPTFSRVDFLIHRDYTE